MRDPRFRWYHMWGFQFDLNDTELIWRTPLFMLQVAYGAKVFQYYTYWWGFSFSWEPNQNMREGELYFLQYKRFVFREYDQMKAAEYSGLPL